MPSRAAALERAMESSLIFEGRGFAVDLALLFSVSFVFFVWLLRPRDDFHEDSEEDSDSEDDYELRRPPRRARRDQDYSAASRPSRRAGQSGSDGASARSTRAGAVPRRGHYNSTAVPRPAGKRARAQRREDEASVRDRSARAFSGPQPAVSASPGPAHTSSEPTPYSRLEEARGEGRSTDSSASGDVGQASDCAALALHDVFCGNVFQDLTLSPSTKVLPASANEEYYARLHARRRRRIEHVAARGARRSSGVSWSETAMMTMASIPEHDDECSEHARQKASPNSSPAAFKAAVEASLWWEGDGAPYDDELARVFEETARNTGRRGSEAGGSF